MDHLLSRRPLELRARALQVEPAGISAIIRGPPTPQSSGALASEFTPGFGLWGQLPDIRRDEQDHRKIAGRAQARTRQSNRVAQFPSIIESQLTNTEVGQGESRAREKQVGIVGDERNLEPDPTDGGLRDQHKCWSSYKGHTVDA